MPELSGLIERMLAKEPQERGTARAIAKAAESAAEHASPETSVPFLDLEWPEAKAQAVPVPAVQAPITKRLLGSKQVICRVPPRLSAPG